MRNSVNNTRNTRKTRRTLVWLRVLHAGISFWSTRTLRVFAGIVRASCGYLFRQYPQPFALVRSTFSGICGHCGYLSAKKLCYVRGAVAKP